MKWEGVIAGLAVAGLNGALALAAVRWALDKGMQVFLTAFIGGMALRMMLVAPIWRFYLSKFSTFSKRTKPKKRHFHSPTRQSKGIVLAKY